MEVMSAFLAEVARAEGFVTSVRGNVQWMHLPGAGVPWNSVFPIGRPTADDWWDMRLLTERASEPTAWWVPERGGRRSLSALTASGVAPRGRLHELELRLRERTATPEPHRDHTHRHVGDDNDLRSFVRVHAAANGADLEASEVELSVYRSLSARRSPLRHHLLLFRRQPTAAMSTLALGENVGVFNMATAPQWQRLGFGRALLDMVLAEAREHGARTASLIAAASAEQFYLKSGFRRRGVVSLLS